MVVYCIHSVYPMIIHVTCNKAGTRGLASSAGRLPSMKKDSEAVTLVRGHSFIQRPHRNTATRFVRLTNIVYE